MDDKVCIIKEQGDLGLFADELNDSDKQLYEQQFTNKEDKEENINE